MTDDDAPQVQIRHYTKQTIGLSFGIRPYDSKRSSIGSMVFRGQRRCPKPDLKGLKDSGNEGGDDHRNEPLHKLVSEDRNHHMHHPYRKTDDKQHEPYIIHQGLSTCVPENASVSHELNKLASSDYPAVLRRHAGHGPHDDLESIDEH